MGRRKTEREKDERRNASAARSKLERVQRRVASRRRMTPMKALTPTRGIDPPEHPMKALTPTRGIDPPEPGTQGVETEVDPAVVAGSGAS